MSYLLLFLLFIFFFSRNFSGDVKRNIKWAEELINYNFNFFQFADYILINRGIDGIQFIFSILIYSFSILIDKSGIYLILLINYLLMIYTFYKIFNTFQNIEGYQTIILFYPLFIIFNYDFVIWSSFLLTDFLFSCLITIFLIDLSTKGENKKLILFYIIILFFMRPTGLLAPIIYMTLIFLNYLKIGIIDKKILIFALVLIPFISFLIWYDFYPDFVEKTFLYHKANFMNGTIIHQRYETYLSPPNNFFDITKIIVTRFIYFFVFLNSKFSIMHNFVNFINYFIIYSLVIYAYLNARYLKTIEKKIFQTMMAAVILFAFFHSVLLIDYDWRYRLPCLLPLSIMALIGFKLIFIKIKIKKKFL